MTEDEKIIDRQTAAEANAGENTESMAEDIAENKADPSAGDSAPDEQKNAEAAEDTEASESAEKKTEDPSEQGTSDAEDEGTDPEKEQTGSEEVSEAAKPDKKDRQIEELNDRYRRLFAEFDNYRKRTDAEKLSMFSEGEKTVLLKVLPLIDNFERALGAVPEDQKGSALAEGIEKVYRAFTDQLGELGVHAIEAVNNQFDANLHNAVMHIEDESLPENIVVEEFQKGYMFKDKVLRYSMVKVAN